MGMTDEGPIQIQMAIYHLRLREFLEKDFPAFQAICVSNIGVRDEIGYGLQQLLRVIFFNQQTIYPVPDYLGNPSDASADYRQTRGQCLDD